MTLLLLLLAALFGLFCHWLKKWARGQTKAEFKAYMLSHRKHSIASVCTTLGAVATLYTVGDVVLSSQTLALAFLSGFTLDSVVNKTPENI
ncbi:hypothetical protein JWZ98_03145 [Methylomonas sp. EFPC1]|uniref:hypothetical protein n=1 Tax=Methylomonas sp. EFPC1 TaxID=2812647 RepID=UPI001966DDCC|nr:hypothetical protein [Methylomonas sp. EFPC1]QSB01972.1 hypothetical protein JWZ98_03145 [Methylomonas sp. EFPC1]